MKPLKPSLGGQLVADLHSTKNHQESSLWQLRGHQESTGEERMRWAVGGSADGCSDVAASTEELEQLAAAWPPTAGPPGSACSPHGRDCGRDDGLHHLAQLTCHASS